VPELGLSITQLRPLVNIPRCRWLAPHPSSASSGREAALPRSLAYRLKGITGAPSVLAELKGHPDRLTCSFREDTSPP
jgi:hypothetical protein